MVKSKTVIATPPGSTIKEQLEERGMTQKEFSIRMDMSEKHISKLVNGEVQLTPDVAMRLEIVLGTPAGFWNRLEAIYREKLIRVKVENEIDCDKEIAKKIPYNEMAQNGWVPEAKSITDKVMNLRKYFEVVSLDKIGDMQLSRIACYRLAEADRKSYSLMAWAQQARIEARNLDIEFINVKKLKEKLTDIQSMTLTDVESAIPHIQEILATCGVALVFLPQIGKNVLHGATFCDGNRIVIAMSNQEKSSDKFWFYLFHEVGHIVLGHVYQVDGTTKADEAAADDFAREMLVLPAA